MILIIVTKLGMTSWRSIPYGSNHGTTTVNCTKPISRWSKIKTLNSQHLRPCFENSIIELQQKLRHFSPFAKLYKTFKSFPPSETFSLYLVQSDIASEDATTCIYPHRKMMMELALLGKDISFLPTAILKFARTRHN